MTTAVFSRVRAAIADVREARAARNPVAAFHRRAAGLRADATADEVVRFLFSGDAALIEPWQLPEEFAALARLCERRRPRTSLEIGTADGGTLFALTRLAAPDALVISIDLPRGPFGGGYPAWRTPLYQSFALPGQRLRLVRADSHAASTAGLLARLLGERRIDFAFIDGDHSYEGVRRDFELCRRFAAADAVIALHDIVEKPNSEYVERAGPSSGGEWAVHRFWKEIRRTHAHAEFVRDWQQEGYGIGVIHLGQSA